jgi:hypothetical protein
MSVLVQALSFLPTFDILSVIFTPPKESTITTNLIFSHSICYHILWSTEYCLLLAIPCRLSQMLSIVMHL